MFGCIAAGRPVQTNIVVLSATQFIFVLPTSPAQPLNHLVVFLLPDAVLPANTAATVYVQLGPTRPFRLLGAIANEKPSAIFRVKGIDASSTSTVTDADEMTDDANAGLNSNSAAPAGTSANQNDAITGDVTLGISIEPLSTVQAALATLPSATPSQTPRTTTPAPFSTPVSTTTPSTALVPKSGMAVPTLIIARRIIKNAFNYLSSFAVKVPGVAGGGDVIPLRSFQDWWTKFEKKIEYDPGFLERED
ncbi:hypothetical protein BDZ91DRAFT_737229 [Kalaharituber pfeilii]|nr:hypothetical protein BDZ91DRAFT_737229 [Kalaharituber pfeilii]